VWYERVGIGLYRVGVEGDWRGDELGSSEVWLVDCQFIMDFCLGVYEVIVRLLLCVGIGL